MTPDRVVEAFDVVEDRQPCGVPRLVRVPVGDQLLLDRREEALGGGVVVGVAAAAHRLGFPTALVHSWGVPALAAFGATVPVARSWQSGVEQTEALVLAAFDGAETMTGFGLTNVYTRLLTRAGDARPRHLHEGELLVGELDTDEEQLALDVVRDVGPGGHFLGHRHTRRHMKEAALPAIAHELGADGHYRDPVEVARERGEAILRDYRPGAPGGRPAATSSRASSKPRIVSCGGSYPPRGLRCGPQAVAVRRHCYWNHIAPTRQVKCARARRGSQHLPSLPSVEPAGETARKNG